MNAADFICFRYGKFMHNLMNQSSEELINGIISFDVLVDAEDVGGGEYIVLLTF